MKTQPLPGKQQLMPITLIQEYVLPFLYLDVGQSLLGALWISVGIGIIMYFYHYCMEYHHGHKDKARVHLFKEMDKHARPVAFLALLYGLISYIILVVETINA
jgi:hypothetical protein